MTDSVQIALITTGGTIIVAGFGLLLRNQAKMSDRMNGRLSELLELTRKSSRAEGAKEQKEHDEA